MRPRPSTRPSASFSDLPADLPKTDSLAPSTAVIATELLEQFLVPVHDTEAAAHLGLGGVSPSSVYWMARKQGGRQSRRRIAWRTSWLGLGTSRARRRARLCQTPRKASSGAVESRSLIGAVGVGGRRRRSRWSSATRPRSCSGYASLVKSGQIALEEAGKRIWTSEPGAR